MPSRRSVHGHSAAGGRMVKGNFAAAAATLAIGMRDGFAGMAYFFAPRAVFSVGPGWIAVALPCRAMSDVTSTDKFTSL
ncbi:unnamed protein product [Heligmosomoides polygyrus]|uniref:Secreted protein n=1 Tax=Heligmosomoides polygyrus TaxID=6339 RepID=A0A183G2X7_HELPZ|nr:unnamed protein product [Heligmosomoides polygyrus]